jgi:hypothetical protein
MKEALRAQAEPHQWVDKLPFTMLGIRTALKEDVGFSSAEMLYGTNLRLPGDMLVKSTQPGELDVTSYTERLKQTMHDLMPAETRRGSHRSPYIDPKMETATHAFIRTDAYKRPLQSVYKGPYKILEKHNKYFKIQLPSGPDNVSIDRLKAAHVDEDIFSQIPPKPWQISVPTNVSLAAPNPADDPQPDALDNPTPIVKPKVPVKSSLVDRSQPRKPKVPIIFNETVEVQTVPMEDQSAPIQTTSSGRQVRRPQRFMQALFPQLQDLSFTTYSLERE